MTADADFLSRLDAAIGCQQCGGPFGDSPSDDFCDDACQAHWHEQNADRLSGYREPWRDRDLPGVGTDAMHWQQPVVWCLRRQTSDLDADESALVASLRYAETAVQLAACALRRQQLDERRRARDAADLARKLAEWRLPRQTGNLAADRRALREANFADITPTQRAAVRLRQQQLAEREAAAMGAAVKTFADNAAVALRSIGEAAQEVLARIAEHWVPIARITLPNGGRIRAGDLDASSIVTVRHTPGTRRPQWRSTTATRSPSTRSLAGRRLVNVLWRRARTATPALPLPAWTAAEAGEGHADDRRAETLHRLRHPDSRPGWFVGGRPDAVRADPRLRGRHILGRSVETSGGRRLAGPHPGAVPGEAVVVTSPEPCENCGHPTTLTRAIPEIGLPVQLFEAATLAFGPPRVVLPLCEHTPDRCRSARQSRETTR